MSNYNEEYGNIKMTAKGFSAVRKAVVAAFNNSQQRQLEIANQAYQLILSSGKIFKNGKYRKGENYWTVRALIDDSFRREEKGIVDQVTLHLIKDDKVLKPRKEDYAPAKARAVSIPVGFEGNISFNSSTKVITWSVDNNNRAVEHAREHPVGRAFFAAMNAQTWTRNTGGSIRYTDEYYQEDWDGSSWVDSDSWGK